MATSSKWRVEVEFQDRTTGAFEVFATIQSDAEYRACVKAETETKKAVNHVIRALRT